MNTQLLELEITERNLYEQCIVIINEASITGMSICEIKNRIEFGLIEDMVTYNKDVIMVSKRAFNNAVRQVRYDVVKCKMDLIKYKGDTTLVDIMLKSLNDENYKEFQL